MFKWEGHLKKTCPCMYDVAYLFSCCSCPMVPSSSCARSVSPAGPFKPSRALLAMPRSMPTKAGTNKGDAPGPDPMGSSAFLCFSGRDPVPVLLVPCILVTSIAMRGRRRAHVQVGHLRSLMKTSQAKNWQQSVVFCMSTTPPERRETRRPLCPLAGAHRRYGAKPAG